MPATNLTHNQLKSANKTELLKMSQELLDGLIASDQRGEQFDAILTELKLLREAHKKAEDDREIFKAANAALKREVDQLRTRLTTNEKDHYQLAQYARKYQLELGTHNKSLKDSAELTNTVATLLSKTGVDVKAADIDVCHIVGKKENGRAIIEFKNRDIRYRLIKNRKQLKGVEVPGHGKLYINESLCPQYKQLDFICRTLRGDGDIHNTWFYNGRLWVVKDEGDDKKPIGHIQDLYALLGAEKVDKTLKK